MAARDRAAQDPSRALHARLRGQNTWLRVQSLRPNSSHQENSFLRMCIGEPGSALQAVLSHCFSLYLLSPQVQPHTEDGDFAPWPQLPFCGVALGSTEGGVSRPLHRSALGKCYLPKQPGKKGVRLAVGFWFRVIGDLRLGAVRGTFNAKGFMFPLCLWVWGISYAAAVLCS